MKRTRLGFIGVGHRGLQQAVRAQKDYADRAEVVAVADVSEEHLQNAADRLALAPSEAYADWRKLLERDDIDAVCISTPQFAHRDIAVSSFEAGKHVYCEKPLTANLAEGDRIVALARQVGRKVAVAHQGVYLPRVQGVQRMLQEGRIGHVQAIHAHGKQDRRGGGEDMITLGTHMFNMMRYFAGDVRWITAHVTVDGRELEPGDVVAPSEPVGLVAGDCINAYYAFDSGISGFFDSRRDQIGSSQRYGMEIIGSEGSISLRGGSGSELMLYPHPVFRPAAEDQAWEAVTDLPDNELGLGNHLAIADLIEAAETDRDPVSSASDAVAALEMILGTYESQITGSRVEIPMVNRQHPLVGFSGGNRTTGGEL